MKVQVETTIGLLEATKGGCPGEFDSQRLFCSFSMSTSPKDFSVIVRSRHDEVDLAPLEVELGAFNYCAEDIAYIELRSDDSEWRWTNILIPARNSD